MSLYLQKRGSIYYYRHRVPSAQKRFCVSLKTLARFDPKAAIGLILPMAENSWIADGRMGRGDSRNPSNDSLKR